MAKAAAQTQEAPAPKTEGGDAPLLDNLNAAVKKMIVEGKEKGFVTYDNLNKALPPEQVSSEQIEDTMTMLSEMDGEKFNIPKDFSAFVGIPFACEKALEILNFSPSMLDSGPGQPLKIPHSKMGLVTATPEDHLNACGLPPAVENAGYGVCVFTTPILECGIFKGCP